MSEKRVLTRDEVYALLRACTRGRGRTKRRNHALVVLLWRTGLRISEALALRPSDLDRREQSVRVRRGKGGKPRTVGLDSSSYEVVRAFLEERATWKLPRRAPMFCTLHGTALNRRYVDAMLRRQSERAALDEPAHAHSFRHTFAAELHREGTSVLDIQRLLGHANLRTTSIYLAEVGISAELLEVVRNRPPIDLNESRVIGIAAALGRSQST